jgi:hypothetical protein
MEHACILKSSPCSYPSQHQTAAKSPPHQHATQAALGPSARSHSRAGRRRVKNRNLSLPKDVAHRTSHRGLATYIQTNIQGKQLNNVTIFNSIYISTEGVFFMCKGYTELTPLVEFFALAWQWIRNLDGNDSIRLHAQGLQSTLFHSLTLNLFCTVLCFEHVKSCLCELSKLFLNTCAEFMIKKHHFAQKSCRSEENTAATLSY